MHPTCLHCTHFATFLVTSSPGGGTYACERHALAAVDLPSTVHISLLDEVCDTPQDRDGGGNLLHSECACPSYVRAWVRQ